MLVCKYLLNVLQSPFSKPFLPLSLLTSHEERRRRRLPLLLLLEVVRTRWTSAEEERRATRTVCMGPCCLEKVWRLLPHSARPPITLLKVDVAAVAAAGVVAVVSNGAAGARVFIPVFLAAAFSCLSSSTIAAWYLASSACMLSKRDGHNSSTTAAGFCERNTVATSSSDASDPCTHPTI